MRTISALLFIATLTLQFASCKKVEITPIDFSKYTATDSSGVVIGEPDITDWTFDTTWTAQELSFVKFNDNIIIVDTVMGFVELSPVLPNPNDGLFVIGVNTERECKMRMVCVNEKMQVLYFRATKFTGGPILTGYDFRALTAFRKNANYRLYYAFFNARDSIYYKGHGDVRIQ